MNRRIIKIFLASSIVEFATERMAIENFIRNISDRFEELYDVKLQPLLCENFDDAYTVVRKQEEYNEKIRSSEFCFFIFFTKAGEYTREEFEVARKKFEETGKPRIYTYFKVVDEKDAEQSLYDFMEELDKTFGHYYGTFEHIDTVKLRIILSLKLEEMDFVEIKAEDGNCVVNGKKVMSLANVAEFANNKYLTSLQEELRKTEEEYLQMKPVYAKGNCSDEFYRRYSAVASKRQSLIDEIEELQGMIFNVSLNLTRDSVRGEISQRQKEAYRLFELGDYEGCMAVLDSNDIDDEFLREEKRDSERRKARRKKYIREYRTKIEILQVMHGYDGRFEEIDQCYKKIVPYALEEKIELDVVYECISFLDEQNKDSTKLAEKLCCVYDSTDSVSLEDKADLFNLMGIVCNHQGCPQKAEVYYQKAIEIYEKLVKENPERFEPDLAMSYNNAGVFYDDHGNPKKAEEYYLKAIEIRERLAKDNPDRFESALATSYNNAGVFYKTQGNPQKAEEYYLKAIEIRERLAKHNPERFEPDLAMIYNNAGNFYKNQGNLQNAEEYYLKAIEIRERLAKENPGRFEPDLAVSYFNFGLFTKDDKWFEKAYKIAIRRPDNPYCRQIIEMLTR